VAFNSPPEGDAVLRVELRHRHFLEQVAPDGLENLLQDLRVEKKRRAEVELEAVRLNQRRAPADARLLFKHGDVQPGFGQQHCARQPARPGAHDQHAL
jgi:hypothetical protein